MWVLNKETLVYPAKKAVRSTDMIDMWVEQPSCGFKHQHKWYALVINRQTWWDEWILVRFRIWTKKRAVISKKVMRGMVQKICFDGEFDKSRTVDWYCLTLPHWHVFTPCPWSVLSIDTVVCTCPNAIILHIYTGILFIHIKTAEVSMIFGQLTSLYKLEKTLVH